MALYIQTNISSINGQRNLTTATNALTTTYQRLSSGYRINSAKDDAAGLQISNRMTTQIEGLYQANRNANDGIALAQTAEGAMDEMTNMYQTIRTQAVQSASGSYTDTDRESLQQDVTAYSEEITRISKKTTFNGQTILSGKDDDDTMLDAQGKVAFQVGANEYDLVSVDLSKGFSVIQNAFSAIDEYFTDLNMVEENADLTSGSGIEVVTLTDDEFLEQFGEKTVDDNGYGIANDDDGNIYMNATYAAQVATITGNDSSGGTGSITVDETGQAWDDLVFSADGSVSGATELSYNMVYTLLNGTTDDNSGNLLVGALFGISINENDGVDALESGAYAIMDVSTQTNAQGCIRWCDEYMAIIDAKRADLGAIQNRMESTITNQANIAENVSDARSRIQDADYAEETANLSQQTIIQQASTTILTQANSQPSIALTLLGS